MSASTLGTSSSETLTAEQMQAILRKQRESFLQHGPPSRMAREAQLDKLLQQVLRYTDELTTAVSEDFGNRARQETAVAEILGSVNGIRHAKKHLAKWMRPQRRPISWEFKPARGKVHYQPLGVVGIIAPWNYPALLALSPLTAALAAGNRAMIKPSELTPRTADLLKRIITESFREDEVAVITGGPEIGQAFSTLPFDHLLYTGSTRVGRLVMMAAAENLVPVTLELGGKSPAIVSKDYPIEKAAASIAQGKLFNAGQTCIAPDYALVPSDRVERFVDSFVENAKKMYPSLGDNPDYTGIVNQGHFERISGLVEDARRRDARIVEVNPGNEDLTANRKIAPTLVLDVNDEMAIMQEEIFGPVLPIMAYGDEREPVQYVNTHPRPLALYHFSNDAAETERVLQQTTSGGACINDTLFHFAQEELPFGGVGPSGIGCYHGRYGFETFSHGKAVFYQSRLNSAPLLRPPYGKLIDLMMRFMIGK